MSRFDQRWRAQRSAISIVNCRIPWTDRDLNAYCAFGISPKACLLQCLCFVVPAAVTLRGVCCCDCSCCGAGDGARGGKGDCHRYQRSGFGRIGGRGDANASVGCARSGGGQRACGQAGRSGCAVQLHYIYVDLAPKTSEHSFTQKELAGKLYITHQAVSNWEKGKALPDIGILSQLGDIYGISIDNLLLKVKIEDKPMIVCFFALIIVAWRIRINVVPKLRI